MRAIYDKIASDYQKSAESGKWRYSGEATFFSRLGDVTGKTVLDLACGEGHYTRRIKECGAGQVMGVDISEEMLKLAQRQEAKNPLGIGYRCFNVIELPKLAEFDVITAAFLLHYSKTKDELSKMCQNISENLKTGGKFVTLNNNPMDPLQPQKKYDTTITAAGPIQEGAALKVTLYADSEEICSFDNYYWEKETYETALRQAGFNEIGWYPMTVSQEGLEKFGAAFWEDYLKQPGLTLLECRKG